jgi:hypothetical protein
VAIQLQVLPKECSGEIAVSYQYPWWATKIHSSRMVNSFNNQKFLAAFDMSSPAFHFVYPQIESHNSLMREY